MHKILVSVIFLILFSKISYASHIVGGEVLYSFIDNKGPASTPYRYKITFNIYIDQYSQSIQNDPPGIAYGVYNASDNKLITTNFLKNPDLVPLIKPNLPPGCTITAISYFGVYVYTFEDIVSLPASATGYHVTYERCCRNAEILNILNPASTGNTFYAFIGSSDYPNNSPRFKEFALPSMCVKDTNTFVNNAYDADGDRLEYSFFTPYIGGYTSNPAPDPRPSYIEHYNVIYAPGYSVSKPFGANSYAYIDPKNGISQYSCPITGNYAIAVQIKEYRDLPDTSILVGVVIRELQFLVADCPYNFPPKFSADSKDSTNYTIEAGEKLVFNVGITDSESDSVTLSAFGDIISGLSNYTGINARFPLAKGFKKADSQFYWQTNCNVPPGKYTISVKAQDYGCPTKTSTLLYNINVLEFNKKPKINGSTSVCPGVKSISYSVQGKQGYRYYWKIKQGNLVSGQGTSSIVVDWPYNLQSIDGEVNVAIESSSGCFSDTSKLKIKVNKMLSPLSPKGVDSLCFQNANIIFDYSTTYSAGSQYTWNISGGNILSGNGSSQVKVKWNKVGTGLLWFTERSEQIEICEGVSDSLRVIIHPTPDSTLKIQGDLTVCEFSKSSVYLISGLKGSKYLWKVSGGDITDGKQNEQIKVNWGKEGIGRISVTETSAFGCTGKEINLDISILPRPKTDISQNNFNICPQNLTAFTYKASGSSNSSFQWTIINGTIVSGQGTSSVTVNWLEGNDTKKLSVIEKSASGCEGSVVAFPLLFDNSAMVLNYVSFQSSLLVDSLVTLSFNTINQTPSVLSDNNKITINRRKNGEEWQIINDRLQKNTTNYNDVVSNDRFIYYYKISGVNNCGFPIQSKEHNTILLQGLRNEIDSTTNLKWNQYMSWPNGVKEYQIWRKLDTSKEFAWYDVVNNTTFEYKSKNNRDGFLYIYKIKAIEEGGESFSWSNAATILLEHDIYIYNVITPDGNGLNDRWEIKNVEYYPDNQMVLFNRWGREIYRKSGYKNDFTGEGVANGIYYYVFTAKTYDFANQKLQNGNQFQPIVRKFSGTISIIR